MGEFDGMVKKKRPAEPEAEEDYFHHANKFKASLPQLLRLLAIRLQTEYTRISRSRLAIRSLWRLSLLWLERPWEMRLRQSLWHYLELPLVNAPTASYAGARTCRCM